MMHTRKELRTLLSAQTLVSGLAIVLLGVLVVLPLASLVWESVSRDGVLTAGHFREALTSAREYTALRNTIHLGLGVAGLSILLGVPMAWAVSRTNLPAKGLIQLGAGVAYILPSLFTSFAYVFLLAPNSGILNGAMLGLGFDRGPFNAFTLTTMIFVISLNTFPFVFFLTLAALGSVHVPFEESGRLLGAGRLRIATRVTLPLVMPGILAGALLSFVDAISSFGPQLVLGSPGRVSTLPSRIYALFTFPPKYGLASSLAIQLLLLTMVGLYLQRNYLGRRSHVTLSGKGVRGAVTDIGRWRYILSGYCFVVLAVSIALPLSFLFWASFSRSWFLGISLENLTLDNYRFILFEYSLTWRSFKNSLVLAATASTILMFLGALISYVGMRGRRRGWRLLDYLSILPFGLPGIVIAVGVLQAWLRSPIVIYGSLTILLLAYLTRGLPVSVRAADVSLRQVDASLEEASRIAGAGWTRSFVHVTIPLIRRGLVAGWVLIFVHLLSELSASILLFTPKTITLGVANFNLYENSELEAVSALAVLTLVTTLLLVLAAWRFGGVRFRLSDRS